MKDISELSSCLEQMGAVLEQHLMEAQSQAADLMWEDAYTNANRDTGAYALSIYKGPTEVVDGNIQTFIGSEATVETKSGKTYNLGWLLETGTPAHLIEPVEKKCLHFITKDGKEVFTKLVNHPGTKANNTYHNAFVNNQLEYQELLVQACAKAFKEAFK